MSILRFIQNNKLFIHYLTVVVVIVGIATLFYIQREARPNVNFNRVTVQVVYPGASPNDIEELVIDPLEEKIAEVDGIEEYRSVSYVGAGQISITIDDNYPQPEEIVDEVRRKISEVKDLPLDVEDPIVREIKASNIPVLNLALYGDLDAFNFKLETEKLKDYLKLQEGVQTVEFSGVGALQIRVVTDPDKLDQYDVTIEEVLLKLSSWAKQKPGGLFENDRHVVNLTIGRDLSDLNELRSFAIRSNDFGKSVKLSDVASIEFDLEHLQSGSLFADKDAVLFTIVKKPFSDAVRVVDNFKEKNEV